MANQLINIARGKIAYYCGLPAASDAVVIVILEANEADDTLNNYDDLSALLGAAGNTEATSTGYSRKSLTSGVTPSIDDSANTAKVVIADQTFSAISQAGSEVWTKLLVCYDDDTGAGTDANIIPLTHHDFSVTPNGGDIVADFDDTNGFWGSS